jgi:hypothetical protein
VLPAQFHESLARDETAGIEMALRRVRGKRWEVFGRGSSRQWTIVGSPNTDITGLCIGSKPSSRGGLSAHSDSLKFWIYEALPTVQAS